MLEDNWEPNPDKPLIDAFKREVAKLPGFPHTTTKHQWRPMLDKIFNRTITYKDRVHNKCQSWISSQKKSKKYETTKPPSDDELDEEARKLQNAERKRKREIKQ